MYKAMIDYGQARGSIASILLKSGGDPNAFRPYVGNDGNSYLTINGADGKPKSIITNADATLRKDDWIELDKAVVKAARPRLKAVADLRNKGLVMNIPNGMGKTVLQTQNMSDISPAEISMSGIRKSTADRPVFDLTNLPLPIVHKDFGFEARDILTSRNSNTPIDTSTAESAARRVAEETEKLLLGTADTFTYAGGTIYGYTNFPQRLTTTMTAPTAVGWTGATVVTEVLAMITQAKLSLHYGPYMLYTSIAWDEYLGQDYSTAKGSNTVRERINAIQDIQDVSTLDYLDDLDGTSFIMILVEMNSDVVRSIIGMDIITLQWETEGGMFLNFKVMSIIVPQLRADINDNTGIVHGTTA